MSPAAEPKPKFPLERRKAGVRYRRLSHTKGLAEFSTKISSTSDPAEEELQRKMWYSLNLQ